MVVLTAERLVKLAYYYPSLYNNWYILASSALAVVNQPQEIGKVFHFALKQQLLEPSLVDKPLLTDKFMLKLAEDSIASALKYDEFTAIGINLPDILVPYSYHDKLPVPFKYNRSEDIHAAQSAVANRVREAILKVAPIAGLPKSINALTALRKVTPNSIRPDLKPQRPFVLTPGHVASSDLVQEDFAGTRFESDIIPTYDTMEGPVSVELVNPRIILDNTVRGSDLWLVIYGKIGTRVKNQMYNAYPDLWQYAYNNVYGPLLSYTGIISAKETSFVVVSALIPQDVNPTLKGHLKGALNQGATKEEIESVCSLTFDLCDWSGNDKWKNAKESVAKL